jgi:phosphoribosylaminoimidazolecarboxamide formyltransferase/IMP cyclohydrolase
MRALISVSDKTGLIEFTKGLVALGIDIISTGGTLQVLKDNGITVKAIDEVTGFPEMLDGRVKTLHPKIHGGLLAVRDNAEHMSICKTHDIGLIDLVVVNLYPFEKTVANPTVTIEDAIENIDIGGPSMLRSAAKNYTSVGVIVNPHRYSSILAELQQHNGQLSSKTKADLAGEAFEHTSRYDSLIASFFAQKITQKNQSDFPTHITPILTKISDLRYGENPHQKAAFYKLSGSQGMGDLIQHHGKELSYNNLIDIESAWQIVQSIPTPAAAIIKHTNPCGTATADTLLDAYTKAHQADPISAFGSIIGLNRSVDKATADAISATFVEVVIAPHFQDDALSILTQKANIRLITLPNFNATNAIQYRFIAGGVLAQTPDTHLSTAQDLMIMSHTAPSPAQITDLLFAMSVVKHVKSNAVIVVKDGVTIGIGAGQMSRVEATEIALKKAGDHAKGAVLASDAFFPFKDSVELAAKAGITAIIHPGGSKRDQESIDVCNDHAIAMATTGTRHFKH